MNIITNKRLLYLKVVIPLVVFFCIIFTVLFFKNANTNNITSADTLTSYSILLHGIGAGGDNVSPNSGGNTNPLHPARTIIISVFDAQNQQVTNAQGTINYNSTNKNFQGSINLVGLAPGYYIIKAKVPSFLGRQFAGIQTITSGQTLTLQSLTLISGDINSDNKISILDYNALFDCFSELLPARNCTDSNKKLLADLTDDGNVNQFDYNLFLRELSVQAGDGNITPVPTSVITVNPTATITPIITGISASPTYDQVKTWAEAYKATHTGNGGKDWDIIGCCTGASRTPAQIAADPAAQQLRAICGDGKLPVIPIIAWEYGGADHPWINPQASALVYCVYIPVVNQTSHWQYDAALNHITADVYVLFPDQNPCKNQTGADQVLVCLGDPTNSEVLVDTASYHDGTDVGLDLSISTTELFLILPNGTKVHLVNNL